MVVTNGKVKTKLKILATGKYLPKRVLYSNEIDIKLNEPVGRTEKISGIKYRHIADVMAGESSAEMAALAAKEAIKNAGLKISDIDCVVSACGSMTQMIPYTGALIHKYLGLTESTIPAFDINSTCLSFLTAIDMLSHLIETGRYQYLLIAAGDTASVGLDENDPETYSIFGDGAAAVILTKAGPDEDCGIVASHMETYSIGTELCELRLGSRYHPRLDPENIISNSLFKMKGSEVFKVVGDRLPSFISKLLRKANISFDAINMLIPHQASNIALKYLQNIFQLDDGRMMDIYTTHGNQVAASIPTVLHESITQRKIQRGDNIMLLGSSAGVSLGAAILRY